MPRTRALLDLAGGPDRTLVCVLVAGTKGKGSTAAMIASILAAAGLRGGLYTSPHLQSWRERVRVDGVAVGARAFATLTAEVLRLLPRLRRRHPDLGEPSAFQILTVAALTHFARRGCRVAVLEVGLGGRYDATNAVEPVVSVIAQIGYDHQAVLGRTLDAIAREKAGVMRPARPVVIAPQRPTAARALARACRERGSHCRTVAPLPPRTAIGPTGAHQRINAALAVAAVGELGIGRVSPAAVHKGLRVLRWPGRIEIVRGVPEVVLDGAHTGESARALAHTLGERYARGTFHVVFGCTRDRDPRVLVRPLLARAVGYATAAADPRALAPERVAAAFGARSAGAYPTVREALGAARRRAGRSDVIVVTGSLALVGEAREALGLPVPERLW